MRGGADALAIIARWQTYTGLGSSAEHRTAAHLTSEGNMMANVTNAQKAPTLKKSLKAERAQDSAKTAKLRALRLAKEQSDKEEAEKLAAEKSGTEAKPRRRRPAKAKMVRMIY